MDKNLFRKWIPKGGEGAVAVVAVHGIASHAGYYETLAHTLTERNISVYALERRGNGKTLNYPGAFDGQVLINDVKDLLNLAKSKHQTVLLFSWCWGWLLAAPTAMQMKLDGLILCAPGNPLQKTLLEKFFGAEPMNGFMPLPFDITRDFSDSEKVNSWIAKDPSTLTKLDVNLRPLAVKLAAQARESLPLIDCPKLAIIARDDRIVDSPATEKALVKAGFPVEMRPGGHDIIFADVDWIASRIVSFIADEIDPQMKAVI